MEHAASRVTQLGFENSDRLLASVDFAIDLKEVLDLFYVPYLATKQVCDDNHQVLLVF